MRAIFPALCFLLLLLEETQALSLYPQILPGTFYAGQNNTERIRQKAELWLCEGGYFVLHQIFERGRASSKHKVVEPENLGRYMTGFWRQTNDGANLILSNRHGLELNMAVGGQDKLYGTLPAGGMQSDRNIVLHPLPFHQPVFKMTATFLPEKAPQFIESSTGRVFQLTGEALATLPHHEPLFVEALVALNATTLTVKRILSFSDKMPSGAVNPQSVNGNVEKFAEFVGSQAWLLPTLAGIESASCVFHVLNRRAGNVEITGAGLRVEAQYYFLPNGYLAFTLSSQDTTMLAKLGATSLQEMFYDIYGWTQIGEDLVLCGHHARYVLEPFIPHRR